MEQERLVTGDKYKITDSIMSHLIGKVVTIKNLKYTSCSRNFYDVTVDDMDGMALVTTDRVLEKI